MKYIFNHNNFNKLQRLNEDLYREVNQLKLQLEKATNDKPSKKATKSSNGTSTPNGTESSGESGAGKAVGGKGDTEEV